MLASRNGHTDIVKVLLAVPDIDVNIQSRVRYFVFDDCCYCGAKYKW